ncbi:DUF2550 family protein [Actinomyces minihominis]|uniref:DUF2550 family protein n=1 Tax=Actinomyces minihominis TaxID=2002838 RepID=UPI000C07D6C6|nr:DUF2550 family protein [Actinomyces minihominis]
MSISTVLLLVLASVVGLALLLVAYLALRAAILVGRKASFGAWVISPDEDQWIRGIALYGQVNLAWFRLASVKTQADLLLHRTQLEVLGGPSRSRDQNYIVIKLRSPEGVYTFALSEGDAAGLISWVNSAPPGMSRSTGTLRK